MSLSYQISCSVFIFALLYLLTKRLKGLAVEIYKMKRLFNWRAAFLFNKK